MNLNSKCVSLLVDLINEKDYLRVSDLAKKYKVTERAVRYNLQKLEEFLVRNGFEYLDKHHLKGIKVHKTKSLEEFAKNYVGDYTPYKYVFSKEERITFVITKLLQSDKPITLEYFQSKLCIAKNTLLKDLEVIEQYFGDKSLKLIKKTRVGIYVEGKEKDKRNILKEMASKTISTKDIFNYLKANKSLSKINSLQFETLFSDIDVDFIDKLIIEAERGLGREFNDESYGNLITHIAIMIKRIQLEKDIYLPEVDVENIICTKEYDISKAMVCKIENHFKVKVPLQEIGYIALRFLGAKVLKDSRLVSEKELNELYGVAKAMTEEMEKIYGVSFEDNKEKVIEGLILHLRPAIYRIKFNLNLTNPMYEEIVKTYKNLFVNTKYASRYFEAYVGSKINDHEISYIALHFGAALENINNHKRNNTRVMLVCGTGIGTAKMLETQIKKFFNVDIVNTVSSRAVRDISPKEYDYIISTIDIGDLPQEGCIKVNAILLKKDYELLKKHLQEKYVRENYIDKEMKKVNELIEVVKKYCTVRDIHQIQYEFMNILLSEYQEFSGGIVYMLDDLLKPEFIKINAECDDWKSALKQGTNILLQHKCVEERYYEEIINNFNDIGPYMVVAPGIVLSHARPEAGVKKLSMSLITLKKPVNFGSENNDPVKLIVTIAATDSESHLKALAQLMELFMNSEDLKKIINSTNKEEVLAIIKNYSI